MKKYNEEKVLKIMIDIFCKEQHKTEKGLCVECNSLYEYALMKLSNCPLKPTKPVCSNCKINCYMPEPREKIKNIMRYSGPRMLLKHPIMGIRYFLKKYLKRKI